MAIKANLFIDQGADYSTSVNLMDDNDNVIDLTGYTANAQIRKTYSSSNAVNFGITIQAANGVLVLSLTHAQTANMTPGRFVYDVIVTDVANVASRVVEGIVTLTPRVTK